MKNLAEPAGSCHPERPDLAPLRITRSLLSTRNSLSGPDGFRRWFAEVADSANVNVERINLDDIVDWSADPASGNIGHRSGKFFTIEGLDVGVPDGPVEHWCQPIINQPEVGILGILLKEFDGVLYCLMQAKAEPGLCNGRQLAPTVQATRSNYMRVHEGNPVPYLEYFTHCDQHRVLADVRQSEKGSLFYRKRNRNMVVETIDDVELLPGFCWLTLGQVHQLLGTDDVVNVHVRTVLSCLPLATFDYSSLCPPETDSFFSSLIRSCNGHGGVHSMVDILRWITAVRAGTEVNTRRIPLHNTSQWRRTGARICQDNGLFFEVIGVSVTACGREVSRWTQPMVRPLGVGIIAFVVRNIGGVLHALVQLAAEPGLVDVVELAPTVQCVPENYEHIGVLPPFVDEVRQARPAQIRFDSTLSEEGGRLYNARNRYLIVEDDGDVAVDHPNFRWMTLHQMTELLRHSHYVNAQARSLVACLHSLVTTSRVPRAVQ